MTHAEVKRESTKRQNIKTKTLNAISRAVIAVPQSDLIRHLVFIELFGARDCER
jgi:hypothetical protein